MLFYLISLGHYPIVLGIPWLQYHDVHLHFRANKLTFQSEICRQRGCILEPIEKQAAVLPDLAPTPTESTTESQSETCSRQSYFQVPESSQEQPAALPDPALAPAKPIALVGAAAFMRLAKQNPTSTFSITISQIDERLALFASDHLTEDERQSLDSRVLEVDEPRLEDIIPSEYHDFLPLFQKQGTEQLPPHRSYDHEIPLQENKQPPFGPLYGMSEPELRALRE